MSTSPYSWVPNALTGARVALAFPVALLALQHRWELVFWLFVLALATDFIDGYAAIRLHARTRLGELLDPVADFTLAACGVLVIIISGDLPFVLGAVMLTPALAVGYVNFCTPKASNIHRLHHFFSVPYLFVVWVGVAWYFATQAYGWAWWYVALTILLLLLAALPKRHRLRAWFTWAAARKK